jgi:hypothetical protein
MRMTPWCLVALCLALGACSGNDETAQPAPPPAAMEPEPAAAPVDTAPAVVDDTSWVDAHVSGTRFSAEARGKALDAALFAPDAVVYLAIGTEGTAAGYTLSAKWIAPDGQLLTEYGQRVEGAGPKVTHFSLSRPDGWTTGRYSVELAINGRTEQTVNFDVAVPTAPTPAPATPPAQKP